MDLVGQEWVEKDFIPVIQQRGAAIIKARGSSSAASAANAAIEHIRDWSLGSNGAIVSMAVYADGSYDIEKGLIYSFPCLCEQGQWKIVQGLKISEFSQQKMSATESELKEERDAVAHLLP
jgi:malate dehydrogenase